MIPQSLMITVGFLIGVFLITVYSYSTNSMILLYAMVAVPPLVFLINRPDFLLVCVVALFTSFLSFPGLPWNFSAFLLFAFLFSGIIFVGNIISKNSRPLLLPYRFALILGLVLLVTASIRGFGIRAFGSETWGGSLYIHLFVAIWFLLMARYCDLTVRQWKLAIYGMCLLSILPAAAQALYALSGGRIYQQFMFVSTDVVSTLGVARDVRSSTGLARFQLANVTSIYVCFLALLMLYRKQNRLVVYALFGVMAILVGLSGHRAAMLHNTILITLYAYLSMKERNVWRVLFNRYTMILGVLFLVLLLFANKLPLAYQRALSWIPFISVSFEAKMDAASTTGWRYEIWQMMLKEMPKYLLLGKGFAFSAKDVMNVMLGSRDEYAAVLATRNYHNALLGTIMDLGLPGLFAALGFIASVVILELKRLRAPWNSHQLQHYHRVFYASFFAYIIVYYFFAGGMNAFINMFIWVVVMEGLARADAALAPKAPEPDAPKLADPKFNRNSIGRFSSPYR